MITNVENFNDQSAGEELVNSIFHGVGTILAVCATVVLLIFAAARCDAVGVASCAFYGFTLIVLFTMSTLYHASANRAVKKVFQVFDHCSVFLLILGTYTPICLSLLRGTTGLAVWGVNAFCTIIGITANAISVRRWHRLSLILYLVMGWSAVFVLRPLLSLTGAGGFALLLAGGLCYTVGVVFYVIRGIRYMHAIWHFLVLCGAILHYFFILFYLVL